MTDLKLYLVLADKTDYDDFEAAVVYANSSDDAIAVTLSEIEASMSGKSPVIPPLVGRWEPPTRGATLRAVEVPTERGPVLGHAKPC